ncbi:MAG TPA: lysylphosphatidylglycerol synthase transmembrane domain-containing protein [Solirubrobacteraceae bacterium]|nr:lysylphosphatidylglycerol synthase transmembrane domain-containing protein [Solirubrobacteraceae bacterium]
MSTSNVSTADARRRRTRSLSLQVILLAIVLGAFAFVVAGLVPGSGARLDHVAVGWIAVEIVAELLACLSYAALFRGVFSCGRYRISFIRSAQISIGELGAFVVVPTGAGGPALRIWALLRSGMPFRTQMVRSVVHAAIFNAPYVLAAIVLGTSVALGVGPGHARLAVALAPLGVVLVTVSIAAGAAVLSRRLRGDPQARWRRIGRDVIEAIPDGVRELPASLRRPGLLLAAAGYWAGDCGVLIVAFHAAHGSAAVGVIVLAYMLGQLGNALPLPGGVGGVEPIMLGVLTASGVDLGLGAAAIILYRFVSLGLQATLGGIAIAGLTASLRRSRLSEDG